MGVGIDVASIIYHPNWAAYPAPILRANIAEQEIQVQVICKAFKWEHTPWMEPSPKRGTTETSCSYSGLWGLIKIALGEIYPTVTHTKSLMKPDSRRFLHLPSMHEYVTYYIPHDFIVPKTLFYTPEDPFGVCSSIKLLKELIELEPTIASYLNDFPEEREGTLSWQYQYNLCKTLIAGCKESIELNLPLQFLY